MTLEGLLAIENGTATVGDAALAPNDAVDVMLGGAWVPVRVGVVNDASQLVVTVDDGGPPASDSMSFPLSAGATIRIKQDA